MHIGFMGVIGALMSAFMNNVAALALLLPVDVQNAKKAKRLAGFRSCRLALRRSWEVWQHWLEPPQYHHFFIS